MRLPLAAVVLIALAATRADAGRGTALVKYLADDATFVVVADVAKARRSPIFAKLFEAARLKIDRLDRLASAAAIDKLVDTIVFGGTQGATEHVVVVVEGRLDKLLAELKKESTGSQTHGKVTYWVVPDGEVALLDKRLVLATAGDMPGVIDRSARKTKGPAQLRTILANATPTSVVFGGAVPDPQRKQEMSRTLGAEPRWAAFSCGMASKLTLDARLKLADDAAAAAVSRTLGERLGAPGAEDSLRSQAEAWIGKDFSESITVDHDDAFARLGATLTAEELDKILSLATLLM